MFSPTDCFIKSPDVALRRFPEWRLCYAYTPAHPELYELNITAWLIVEMCEGQPLADLERAYLLSIQRKAAPDEGRALLYRGLRDLVDKGILVQQRELPISSDQTIGANNG